MEQRRVYEEPEWNGRLRAIELLRDPASRGQALASLGLNDLSPEFIEGVAIGLLASAVDVDSLRLALIAISHSARRHRRLAFDETKFVVERLTTDKEIGGTAEDALSDIDLFVR